MLLVRSARRLSGPARRPLSRVARLPGAPGRLPQDAVTRGRHGTSSHPERAARATRPARSCVACRSRSRWRVVATPFIIVSASRRSTAPSGIDVGQPDLRAELGFGPNYDLRREHGATTSTLIRGLPGVKAATRSTAFRCRAAARATNLGARRDPNRGVDRHATTFTRRRARRRRSASSCRRPRLHAAGDPVNPDPRDVGRRAPVRDHHHAMAAKRCFRRERARQDVYDGVDQPARRRRRHREHARLVGRLGQAGRGDAARAAFEAGREQSRVPRAHRAGPARRAVAEGRANAALASNAQRVILERANSPTDQASAAIRRRAHGVFLSV